jgi:hypothetical protein
MNARKHNLISVLATGVIVVILVSLVLFWARWLCSMQRVALLPPVARRVTVQPSSPLFEISAPRVPRGIGAEMTSYSLLSTGLGALQYVPRRQARIFQWDSHSRRPSVYYDAARGLIVYAGPAPTQEGDGTHATRRVTYYAGPEGVGEAPDVRLGRFRSPVADRSMLRPQIVYDPTLRRFFAIDWPERTVRQGPKLADKDPHQPVQIRVLWQGVLGQGGPDLHLVPPSLPRDIEAGKTLYLGAFFSIEDRVLVLDASGRIDLLDPQTLEIVGAAGRLVSPTTLFGSPRLTKPEDVLSFSVTPIGVGQDRAYGGCAVATISRDAIGMRLNVYDANGGLLDGAETGIPQYREDGRGEARRSGTIFSAGAAYVYLPGAQVLTLAKFALESLHPPVFLLASYLAGPHLEAAAGYRSLFLLPDSFVAMSARGGDSGLIERSSRAFGLALPALLLSLLLAWRVTRDGGRLGLSKNARALWLAGTVVFGLPAYLTYRLTWPKVALVTCTNCGVGRRLDWEKCHRCGSPWLVPELTPPAWRVVGEPEPVEENSLSREPQTDIQVQ